MFGYKIRQFDVYYHPVVVVAYGRAYGIDLDRATGAASARFVVAAGYRADRCSWARLRRQEFHGPPTRRNRVWQTDFSEFETAGVAHCAGGYRSSVAASVLRAAGRRDVSDLLGGYQAWTTLRPEPVA